VPSGCPDKRVEQGGLGRFFLTCITQVVCPFGGFGDMRRGISYEAKEAADGLRTRFFEDREIAAMSVGTSPVKAMRRL